MRCHGWGTHTHDLVRAGPRHAGIDACTDDSAQRRTVEFMLHHAPPCCNLVSNDPNKKSSFQRRGTKDTRGEEILAAAITPRDSSGRDRKDALRKMANAWGVTVNEKVEGKYKPRPNSVLAEDIQAFAPQTLGPHPDSRTQTLWEQMS